MQKGGRKFSFSRLILNTFPNFSNDAAWDVDLSPQQADDLVEYQLGLANPRYLDKSSFYIAKITDNKPYSEKVYNNLLKTGVINEPTPDNSKPPVNTAAIGKNFANQHAVISVHAQRKLVGLLFLWEEECTRWKLLDQEEAEILKAIEDGNMENKDLEMALQAVEMKKKLLPSQRAEHTANVTAGVGHDLPAYEGGGPS